MFSEILMNHQIRKKCIEQLWISQAISAITFSNTDICHAAFSFQVKHVKYLSIVLKLFWTQNEKKMAKNNVPTYTCFQPSTGHFVQLKIVMSCVFVCVFKLGKSNLSLI